MTATKSNNWFTRPPAWLFFTVLGLAMVVMFFLASNKIEAVVWDVVFLALLFGGEGIRRYRCPRK